MSPGESSTPTSAPERDRGSTWLKLLGRTGLIRQAEIDRDRDKDDNATELEKERIALERERLRVVRETTLDKQRNRTLIAIVAVVIPVSAFVLLGLAAYFVGKEPMFNLLGIGGYGHPNGTETRSADPPGAEP